MATNYVQPGDIRTITNASGAAYVSGQLVRVGQQLAVCQGAIANGASGEAAFAGVFTVPKVSAAVIADGEMVMWDASAAAFDDNLATPASGDVTNAASAVGAFGNTITSMQIQLANRIGTVA
jgi:predicted RecA/RadA family phage recombinase